MNYSRILYVVFCGMLLCRCTTAPERDYLLVLGPGQIIVRKNENIYSVAHDNNVHLIDLIELNRIQPPYGLKEGQVLLLPKNKLKYGKNIRDHAHTGPILLANPMQDDNRDQHCIDEEMSPFSEEGQKQEKDSSEISQELSDELKKSEIEEPLQNPYTENRAAEKLVIQKNASSSVLFVIPAPGAITTKFNASIRNSKKKCNGIRISTKGGECVVASRGGTISYSGNELGTNLVLIEHKGGWMTAYGNLSKISVIRGQKINQGQKVGISQGTLHFELRRDRKLVDPEKHIK